MKIRGAVKILNDNELNKIEASAIQILTNTGINLQNSYMLKILAEHGWPTDMSKETVFFPPNQLEEFLQDSEQLDWDNLPPLRIQGGLYTWQWLPPDADKPKPATIESTVNLTRLGDYLDNIDTMCGMGTPSDVPKQILPLWQYFISWRYAAKTNSSAGGIFNRECIPYLKEMGSIMAAEKGGTARDYVSLGMELISPLRFGRYEAEVYYQCYQEGLAVGLMSMPSLGGTAPVTLAGACALQLAEIWACNILNRVFYGTKKLYYISAISVIDMRQGFWRFGRPESALLHMALGQLAYKRGAAFTANCFACDAKRPSVEAGYQKALDTIPAILAGTIGTGSCGMLSLDEYNSPIQLILDNEFAGALKRMTAGFDISDETLALDLINRIGPGGNYLAELHTAKNFRTEIWFPKIWTGLSDSGWMGAGCKLDIDYARDIYEEVMKNYHPRGISEKTEKKLMDVIKTAEEKIVT
ncbi:MAG: trimethylamine methyltransferase family protein [Candidatus Omnitrophota bacterium]